MSNDTDELQRLQIAVAKVMGHSVNKGERGRYYLFNSDGSTLQGGSVTAEDAWRVFLHTCKWGKSADANRELLEWLAVNEADRIDKQQGAGMSFLLPFCDALRGIMIAPLVLTSNIPAWTLCVLLASPLDVLWAFVAATAEGDGNG